jgi:hypothetical protein
MITRAGEQWDSEPATNTSVVRTILGTTRP